MRGAVALQNAHPRSRLRPNGTTHMNIFRRIARTFRRESDPHRTAAVIDYLRDSGGSGDWRKRKLEEAAQKYGRPFKCAGEDMPHEIMLRDRIVMVAERTRRF